MRRGRVANYFPVWGFDITGLPEGLCNAEPKKRTTWSGAEYALRHHLSHKLPQQNPTTLVFTTAVSSTKISHQVMVMALYDINGCHSFVVDFLCNK